LAGSAEGITNGRAALGVAPPLAGSLRGAIVRAFDTSIDNRGAEKLRENGGFLGALRRAQGGRGAGGGGITQNQCLSLNLRFGASGTRGRGGARTPPKRRSGSRAADGPVGVAQGLEQSPVDKTDQLSQHAFLGDIGRTPAWG